jgi:hypothetical protein
MSLTIHWGYVKIMKARNLKKNGDVFMCNGQQNILITEGWEIPRGGKYYIGVTSKKVGRYKGTTKIYHEGEKLPYGYEPTKGDIFILGDYEYRYGYYCDYVLKTYIENNTKGWGVHTLDKTKISYGEILQSIANKPVVNMNWTFANCKSLEIAPIIPDGIKCLRHTFNNCISLMVAPDIPKGITDMYCTFLGCESLEIAPTIPNGVENIAGTFSCCKALIIAPEIPSSVINMNGTFNECESLEITPEIPNGVIYMNATFKECQSLEIAPTIPSSVIHLNDTFAYCFNLVTAPTIPNSIKYMNKTFWKCIFLTGNIEINANPIECAECFYGVDFENQDINLIGNSDCFASFIRSRKSSHN